MCICLTNRWTLTVLLVLTASTSSAEWPHWRGPTRNDVVSEPSGWDAGGWATKNIAWSAEWGEGSTSPLVADGRVFVMGWKSNTDTVFCIDASSGREVWRQTYSCPRFGRHATGDQGLYSGPTSSPEFDAASGLLYTLSCDGDLHCWNTKDGGAKVWHINLYDKYGMEQRPKVGRSGRRDYGYTTAPLVDGDRLLVEVGGKAGTVMAFDKQTGRQLWASEATDFAGHTGGLAPMTVQGIPCVAVLTFNGLLVVRLDKGHEGKTVATFPWVTDFANNIAMPAVEGEAVLITSGYNQNAMCKLKIALDGATVVWKQEGLVSKTCSPVLFEGSVYWAWDRLRCVDFASGKVVWEGPRVGDAGSCIITGDEKLIVWCGRGDLILAETMSGSPGGYKQLARLTELGSDDVWPHVALSGDKIYCKDRRGRITCLAVDGGLPQIAAGRPRPSSSGSNSPTPTPQPPVDSETPEKPVDVKAWPGDDEALVLAWQRSLGAKLLGRAANDKAAKIDTRGAAEFDRRGTMQLSQGAFIVTAAERPLLTACQASNQLAIEVVLSCDNITQTGPARIVSFSTDPYHRNFTLCQERSDLLLRLRTTRTGENGMQPQTTLCKVQPNVPYHLIATYRPGHQVVCYLNGEPVATSGVVQGDFSNWTAQHFLIGDEWQDSRFWSGAIERIAVLSRFIGPAEAHKRYELSGLKR